MSQQRNRPVGKTFLFGMLSVALYAAVFTHSAEVVQLFARGAWYAVLPIATVFIFSLVHGTFAHSLWTLLGIEPRKTTQPQPRREKRAPRRKRLRVQPGLRAR
jgi:hypothetical protein